jgi:hypothetical protein
MDNKISNMPSGTALDGTELTVVVQGGVTKKVTARTLARGNQLTAALNIYVRPDGSDSNLGLTNTAGGAFLTIQRAVRYAATFDTSQYNCIINIADGTYPESVIINVSKMSQQSVYSVEIKGNTITPTNVNVNSITARGAHLKIGGVDVDTVVSEDIGDVYIEFSRIKELVAKTGSVIFGAGSLVFRGNHTQALYCDWGRIHLNASYTLESTPVYSVAFAYAKNNGAISFLGGITATGACTGPQYKLENNGTIEPSTHTVPGSLPGIGAARNNQTVTFNADYAVLLTDEDLIHSPADATARAITIPANASVAIPVGRTLRIVNPNGAGVVTIAITTDTMRLAGAGTTGSRTLAANGVAYATKVDATNWIIHGTGLT